MSKKKQKNNAFEPWYANYAMTFSNSQSENMNNMTNFIKSKHSESQF